jgi:poly(glycerol-phosphate) alpha-glucosyltransferase
LIASMGLSSRVTLHGHSPQAADELETAGMLLSTSKSEGQGLTVMEAMGRGCVPIAFDMNYGPKDMIENGINGVVVPPGDTEGAADAIVRLVETPVEHRQMSSAAYARAERFSKKAVASRWAEVLDAARSEQARTASLDDLVVELQAYTGFSDGSFEVRCFVSSSEFQRQDTDPELVLRLVARSTKNFIDVAPAIIARNGSVIDVVCTVNTAALEGFSDAVDCYLNVSISDVINSIRIGFGNSANILRPYSTIYGNLSLKN